MKDKRGLELVWNNVVVMILALVVLIFLITFFLTGSSGFIDSIKSYFSGSNIDSIVQECNLLVDTEQEYSYCCEIKEVKLKDDKFSMNCNRLQNENFVNNRIKFLSCEDIEC